MEKMKCNEEMHDYCTQGVGGGKKKEGKKRKEKKIFMFSSAEPLILKIVVQMWA
jgi:hypothetical protein